MKLTLSQAKEILQAPKNLRLIEKARVYESTLRLYTEEKFRDELGQEISWDRAMSNLSHKLSVKKFQRLQDFIKYPLPVVNIGKGVLKDIYKIFDSMNSYFHVEFMSKANQQNIQEILNAINLHKWLVHQGKEALKNKPNMIVVVDRDEKGIPYLVEVDTCRLIDVSVKEDSTLEYIAFIHSVKIDEATKRKTVFQAVYDDEFYRVFKREDGGEPVFVEEQPHGVGYCPARMILTKRLTNEDEFNRAAPISPVMSKLEEWMQFEIYKYYVDHYASFPIVERAVENCSVQNCNNGKIESSHFEYTRGEGDAMIETAVATYHDCPECSKKSIIGPGTEFAVVPKQNKDDVDSSGLFRFISPDMENLRYLDEKMKNIEQEIYLKSVGENELMKTQAVNKDQVAGSFESKKNILIMWKSSFDHCYKWIVNTLVLTYNPAIAVQVHADFGTEFYLIDEGDLQARFKLAKENGMPASELDMIFNQLIETKYRSNPHKLQRMRIISLLDPMPYDTPEEATAKAGAGLVSPEQIAIKNNLINFVNRFELENGSIVEFGKDIDLMKKINTIKEIFNSYIYVKDETKPL